MLLNTVNALFRRPTAPSSRRQWLVGTGLLMAGTTCPWRALALAPAVGTPLLTVKGKLSKPNAGALALFDGPLLEQLPQHSFDTSSPWHKGKKTYTGPLLREVLAAAGAKGQTVHAEALNDYKVNIPFDDAHKWDVIVARLINGQALTVRDKGPLLIMYPFDQRPDLRTALYYNRCIWQLRSLDVR